MLTPLWPRAGVYPGESTLPNVAADRTGASKARQDTAREAVAQRIPGETADNQAVRDKLTVHDKRSLEI